MAIKCPKCHTENPDTKRFCGDCGTQLSPAEDIAASPTKTLEAVKEELTTGSTFANRYQVIEELGKGGMGKVYKVLDTELKEKVALKLLNPEIAADKDTIERFRNELKFARKITHKNVCRMYDLSKEEGTYYITMEYVDGKDLKRMIRMMGQLSAGKSISIAKQVCEGLSEAHKLGVVHRDLKPQNIMVDEEGNARIMDFGIARSLKAKGITGAGVMIGTPEYMSPEQAEVKEVDKRSDIYSLGVILYEMVTGRVPFEGETPISIAMKHKSETPRSPKEINVQVPDDLSRLILKCMEKGKEKRYQSAEEILSELTKIEEGIPTAERVVPKRKPLTTKEITVTFSLKKLLLPALIVAAVAIIAIIIWQLLPKKVAIPLPTGKPSLAVMYFENNTGDENLDHWRKALSELLIADLSQSKYINVLGRDKLFNILRQMDLLEAQSYSSEDLEEVAAQGRVNHILQGAYAKAGDNIRINVTLQQAGTGELIGSESVEGRGEESIFSMVDELTRRVKANFKLSEEEIASDIDKIVGKITTSSPEAYKYYSEGVKHYVEGDYRKAIQSCEQAVARDPEFATAYRTMSGAYGEMQYRAEKRKYLQKALELSDRASDRERYRIQGDFYRYSEKTYDKAIEAYYKLLELYPEDLGGNNSLGNLYRDLEEWDKAIEKYEVLIQNKEETFYPYVNQAYSYTAKGLYGKAREVLENYLHDFIDNVAVRHNLAIIHLCQGNYELALVEVDKGLALNPAFYYNQRVKGDIYHCQEDFVKAEQEYQKLMEYREPAAQAWGRAKLASLYFTQGRFEKAKDLLKQGIEWGREFGEKQAESNFRWYLGYAYLKSGDAEEALKEFEESFSGYVESESVSAQRFLTYLKGLAYIEMKSIEQAQRKAAQLKEMIEKGLNRKAIRFYHHLVGTIEFERKNFSKAVENFKKAISMLPSQHSLTGDDDALFIDSLALFYHQQGELEKAGEEYEKIISLTSARLPYGDICAKALYMLGKIYEQKGWKGKAIEHYEKFLEIWKDADKGIPEVIEAKERLAGLKE